MTQLCLTTYKFPSFTHTHNGDDTLPRSQWGVGRSVFIISHLVLTGGGGGEFTHARGNKFITFGAITTVCKRIEEKRIWVLVDDCIKLIGKCEVDTFVKDRWGKCKGKLQTNLQCEMVSKRDDSNLPAYLELRLNTAG